MYWFASTEDQAVTGHLSRFDPRFWTVNFPRPMMASVVSTAWDALEVRAIFYREEDLAGLIWESEDHWDHPLLAYQTNRDYRGMRLSFRWQSNGIKPLDAIYGPTLTIEGRDQAGTPKAWFVRLWNYAKGNPTDAHIDLDFDAMAGGFLLPSEADPVWAGDIDRIFISMVAPDYDPGGAMPLAAPVEGWAAMSEIRVFGGDARLPMGEAWHKPHDLRITNGYDDVYNLTPARIWRNIVQLGYRRRLIHYVGMSHYYRLAWNMAEGRFVVDPLQPLNICTHAWHQDYFARAVAEGFSVTASVSYELLNQDCPNEWQQRDHAGSPALTGWEPPSSLIPPTHQAGLQYLADVMGAFADLQSAAGLPVSSQIGEPWWWADPANDVPHIYDVGTEAAYQEETGLPVPAKHFSVTEIPDAAQQAYLDWCGGKLAGSVLWLRDQLHARYPEAETMVLFYTPQVLRDDAPMLASLNYPAEAWADPAFSRFQLEDYDFVIDGEWPRHTATLRQVQNDLGYPLLRLDYFAGFNLLPETAENWANIDRAAVEGLAAGYGGTFVWAYPQIFRDGYVTGAAQEDEEEQMSGFHEIRFPEAIAYGSTGGPGFSTQIVITASGHEQRNINWSQARARYNVGTGLRSEEDLMDLISFFRARAGKGWGFRFKDCSDFRSGSVARSPTPVDQVIGTGDGLTTQFQLIKTYASGPVAHVRQIAKPVTGSVRVALDAAEQGDGWSVDDTIGLIHFESAPAEGVVISAGFDFDVPVRFDLDQLDIALETFRAGSAPDVPLVEVRL